MDTKLIARLIDLVRKTGDRVVVPDDTDSGRAVVIMDLDAYENLMNSAVRSEPLVEQAPVEQEAPQTFEPEPMPVLEQDVVQQIRAIRKEPESRVQQQPQIAQEEQVAPAPPTNLPMADDQDLTQPPIDAKIKPEIGDWKTVGQVRPSVAPKSDQKTFGPAKEPLNQPTVQEVVTPQDQLEEEERFYLEPIE
jgi:hypothetical protein